jgi:hypothetical protein
VLDCSARVGRSSRRQHLPYPVVGDLELSYEPMELPADPGLTIHVYGAEPASPSADALDLLAGWAATLDQTAATGNHASERPI